MIFGLYLPCCTGETGEDTCTTHAEGCACGAENVCDDGLICEQDVCEVPAETEKETDSGSEDENGECAFDCVAPADCNGTLRPETPCGSSDVVCCESGSDGDSDADTDGDSDADTDADADGDAKFVGNITTRGVVRADFMDFWDQITPENEGKWSTVEGTRDVMSWSALKNVYNYAEKKGIPFKQHCFVWGSQYPTWIDSLSADEQAAEIEEWISEYCGNFPNTAMIDVVNEALPDHRPARYAEKAFGGDWIIRSFELAHQYCPNAVLILNDYNVFRWNTDTFMALAEPVIESGYLDAVGEQAHGLGGGSMGIQPVAELKANIAKIVTLGVDIYVTEYDIEQTDDQTQLEVMKEQFPVMYETPEIKGITYWGYLVGATWREGTGLLNTDGTPRPALTWLMDYLHR